MKGNFEDWKERAQRIREQDASDYELFTLLVVFLGFCYIAVGFCELYF